MIHGNTLSLASKTQHDILTLYTRQLYSHTLYSVLKGSGIRDLYLFPHGIYQVEHNMDNDLLAFSQTKTSIHEISTDSRTDYVIVYSAACSPLDVYTSDEKLHPILGSLSILLLHWQCVTWLLFARCMKRSEPHCLMSSFNGLLHLKMFFLVLLHKQLFMLIILFALSDTMHQA